MLTHRAAARRLVYLMLPQCRHEIVEKGPTTSEQTLPEVVIGCVQSMRKCIHSQAGCFSPDLVVDGLQPFSASVILPFIWWKRAYPGHDHQASGVSLRELMLRKYRYSHRFDLGSGLDNLDISGFAWPGNQCIHGRLPLDRTERRCRCRL